jgi:hypothetical protein
MSAVFLTNVLIVVALVVLQTQTAVADITVVREDSGLLVNLMCVVNIVLGNLVVQAMTVVARARLATLIVNAQLSITEALLRTLSHHG